MNTEKRLARIEHLLAKMASALQRRGSEQDGAWLWPPFHEEMEEIQQALRDKRGDEGDV